MWANSPIVEMRQQEEGDDTRYTYFATTLGGSLVDLTPFGNALPSEHVFREWADAQILGQPYSAEPQGHGFVTGRSRERMEPREIEATDPEDVLRRIAAGADPIVGRPFDLSEAPQPTGRRLLDVGD